VSAGPANESGQNVTFQVTNSNNPLFAVQPAIASNGTLTYTPAANANGAATVTVSLSDNGGGADTSADQTVTITVNAVNDAPAITAPASVAIVEDTPHTFTGLGGITVADPDLAAGLLTVTLTATSTVDLGAPGAISITGGADGTNVVSFTGTIVQVNQALNGLVYTPTANQISGASLTIEVSDGGATGSGGVRTTTHVVNFPITSVNDTPVAASDAATTPEDTAVTIAVLANDVDADGDPLGVSILAPPANGTVTINPDATITYTPNANFFGTDRFDYTATDPSGASDSERVDITITAVNDLPVAGDDAASTNQDTAVTINVLANDSDVESTVSVSAVGTPSNGTAVLNVDGTVTYTPAQYWFGEDTFTYTLTDGTATSTGTVAVTVVEVNSAPVANDDATAVAVGGSIEVDVLANDTDPDGDTITLVSVDSPTAGAIDNLGNGRLRYTASASEAGTVTVSYTISDPAGRTSTANLIIDVYGPSSDGDGVADSIEDGAPNDGDGNGDGVKDSEQDNVASFPVAAGPHVGKFVTVGVNSPAKLTNAGSRANPSESDYPVGASSPVGFLQFDVAGLEPGASTVVTIDVPPGVNATSYLKYGRTTDNPEPHWYDFGYDGETGALVMNDKIYLFLKDGARGDDDRSENGIIVDPGTPVFGLNAAPVAVDDVLALDEDTSADIDVRANDSDPDGDALTVAVIEQPANGTVEVLQDGTLHYTPAADFFGDDAFTYQVGDDQGGADEATVQVTVSGTQDAPRTTDDSAETPEGTAVTVDIFQNDVDPDGDVFHLTSQGLPANGTSVYNDDGTVTYTPAPGFSGVDSWTYTISDGPGASGQTVFGRITVTVTAVQKAPVGVPDDIEGPEDELILFDPLDNDSDPDGDDIFVVSVTQPTEGGVVTLEQGLIELVFIEPDPDYSGTFTFTYTISDGERLSDPVLVTVTLLPVNDAPVFPTTEVIFESFDAITQLVEPVVVRFREASDVDDTELMYRWELSSTASFSDVVHAVEVVTLTTDETGLASFTVTADTLSEALFLEPGADVTLFQRMVAIDASDAETVSAAQQVTFVRPASVSVGQATELPTEVYLSGNYPNPFNPTTTIAFGLPEADAVRIEVYDMQGRLARILVNRTMEPGHHHVQVDLSGLSSGVYVYRLTTNTIVKTRTLQLLK
jgi:VCBS repeat-containing protein